MRLNALTLTFCAAIAASSAACGAGSELDDYQDGLPEIVPSPVKSSGDGGVDGPGSIGSACTNRDSCEGEGTPDCVTTFSVGVSVTFPRGYCTESCTSAAQCPTGSSCFALAQSCLKTCTSDSECRMADGYSCAAPPLSGTQKFCLPASVAGLLGGGGTMGGFLAGLLGGGNTGGLIGGGNTGGLIGGGNTAGGGTSGGFLAGLFGGGGGGTPGGTGQLR